MKNQTTGNAQTTGNTQTITEEILEKFHKLPKEMQRDFYDIITALADADEKRKEIMLRFMDWTTKRDPAESAACLSVLAIACRGNEFAWGSIETTVAEEEQG